MNLLISGLLPIKYNYSNYANQQYSNKNYSNSNLAPLQQDCVTFTAASKKNRSVSEDVSVPSKKKDLNDEERRANKVPYELACDVYNECKEPFQKLFQVLESGLKGAVESKANPNAPIAKNGIKGRVKSPESIMEKVPPRELRRKNEIFKMGDIIGTRIVLKRTSQKDFDLVFKELGKMVKSGKLHVIEVENYRNTPNDSYISKQTLDKFELDCQKAGMKPKISSEPKASGYTAIHLTVVLPDGKYAEIQIMGQNMERVKDIEDFFYKKRNGKLFSDKYQSIRTVLDEAMGKTKKLEKLDNFQIETLDRYIADSYANALRIDKMVTSNVRISVKDLFLPIPYSLPEQLGFGYLYKMKEECDKK